MWQDLFGMGTSVPEKLIRSVVVYLLLVVIFRIIGKRTISAMSTIDFVLLFLLSNVVQNAIIGDDNSLLGGAIGAVTVVLTDAGIDRLTLVSPLAERIFVGSPVTVIEDGVVDSKALDRIGLTGDQLKILVHLQDGDDVAQVKKAAMSADGHLLVEIEPAEQDASRGDIAALNARLDRIEALLTAR